MLRRLYARLLALSATRHAPLWLAAVAFAEASVFPLPPDMLLVPMVLARPRQAWRLAAICTAGSVAGGALGYLIGATLFDSVAAPLLRAYHYGAALARFQEAYATYGVWVILLKGVTPIPYKLVTIASGAAHFDFAAFMAASLATRGGRFFLLAGLVRRFGPQAAALIERRLGLVLAGAALAAAGGLAAAAWL